MNSPEVLISLYKSGIKPYYIKRKIEEVISDEITDSQAIINMKQFSEHFILLKEEEFNDLKPIICDCLNKLLLNLNKMVAESKYNFFPINLMYIASNFSNGLWFAIANFI